MNSIPVAHVTETADGQWKRQSLAEHLQETARLAGKFAAKFANQDWGELLGLWHDIGKFHPGWQAYLRRKSGWLDPEAHLEGQGNRPNHSSAGAVLALEKGNLHPAARILAYPLAGHHAGLPDWYSGEVGADLCSRLFQGITARQLRKEDLEQIRRQPEAGIFLEKLFPRSTPVVAQKKGSDAGENWHLWIRMLFSCLVDADFLNTESFMEPKKGVLRKGYVSLQELKQRFDDFMAEKERSAPDTEINRTRKKIRELCCEKARLEPGFFSLTVPTGGGKTLSSMAFALEHALHWQKERIIMAIPFTSIIEQTAKVLKYGSDNDREIQERKKQGSWLFGEDQVVEHHSNLDAEKDTPRNRLAAENWDAPIIVTTNVQLFESLFASRVSACRKLHNIVNSIIILDEVQMLEPEFLRPILSALNGLVNYFGVTVVLMTATQPTLEGAIGQPPNAIHGLENVRPIVEHSEELAKRFERVHLHLPGDFSRPISWSELAAELSSYEQVLCIVNSRKDCRELHALMPEDTVHLSALMCGEERSVVISEIKEKLRNNEPVRVISTQLVEAGVDIDFPVVYRALAGLDSIAQAAGRCNRENRLAQQGRMGKMVVFIPPHPAPPGLLRKGQDACKEILRNHTVKNLFPELFQRYFRFLFSKINSFDKPQFHDRLVRNSEKFEFQFRTLARDFQLIEQQAQPVLVWYENPITGVNSMELIEQLRNGVTNRQLMRKLQRFVVNVYPHMIKELEKLGFIENMAGYWVQTAPGIYRCGLGLVLPDEQFADDLVI